MVPESISFVFVWFGELEGDLLVTAGGRLFLFCRGKIDRGQFTLRQGRIQHTQNSV